MTEIEPPPSESAAAQSTQAPPPPPPLPAGVVPPPRATPREWLERRLAAWRAYFLGRDPSFSRAFLPMLALSLILFSRLPSTNYIFDEQEALLANPYVNATQKLRFIDAIHRDFWGLPPDHSVGSYRPIPDFLWRAIWQIHSSQIFKAPFLHHIYNVVFHAANAALLTVIVWAWTKRRGTAYLAGFIFLACAVLTEAVSGIVGIADVLGGMGAILALLALSLPAWAMPAAVFCAVMFGLFCKESALVCVPLIPFAAIVAAPLTHPNRPRRFARAALSLAGALSAFVVYVELRRRWFPSPLPEELKNDIDYVPWTSRSGELVNVAKQTARDFFVWFHQAPLPKDPLNNPLAKADVPHRVGGALRVFYRGLRQVVAPVTLSGDYSFPQEPVPPELPDPKHPSTWTVSTWPILAGAFFTLAMPLAGVVAWVTAMARERAARLARAAESTLPAPSKKDRVVLLAGMLAATACLAYLAVDLFYLRPRGEMPAFRGVVPWAVVAGGLAAMALGAAVEASPAVARPDEENSPVPLSRAALVLVAIGLVWIVVSYFPHSNIPVVLPTVRAERFWYFPAIGSSMALAAFFASLEEIPTLREHRVPLGMFALFLAFQCVQAYRHASDYRDDLDFWHATEKAVPNSAKAHLNYSVMVGARNDLATRLAESKEAIRLAPEWPMAYIYTGDTLCRMKKLDEAWPYYKQGFELGPNEQSLIALALQCLYDEGALVAHDKEIREIAAKNEGSWIAFLGIDTLLNSDKNKGVDPKYRPRGYNEGPKD